MKLKVQRDGKIACEMTLTWLKNGDIEIEYVRTLPEYRNQGLASILLKKAIAISDKMKIPLVGFVEPDKSGGLSYDDEIKWLTKYGVVQNKKYDFGNYNIKSVMIYYPK